MLFKKTPTFQQYLMLSRAGNPKVEMSDKSYRRTESGDLPQNIYPGTIT